MIGSEVSCFLCFSILIRFQGREGLGAIYTFASGNGGLTGDSCAYNGYVNSIYTIAINGVNMDSSNPSYAEECPGIMATAYSRDTIRKFGKVVSTPVHDYLVQFQKISIPPPPPPTEGNGNSEGRGWQFPRGWRWGWLLEVIFPARTGALLSKLSVILLLTGVSKQELQFSLYDSFHAFVICFLTKFRLFSCSCQYTILVFAVMWSCSKPSCNTL